MRAKTPLAWPMVRASLLLALSLCACTAAYHLPSSLLQTRAARITMEAKGVDVSDLGLTMADLEKPLPRELTDGIASNGYESTSRLPGNQDRGCVWAETSTHLEASITIEGLRGQPAAAMDAAVTDTTLTLTAFGRDVWSCVLRGRCVPDTFSLSAEDGMGMLPVCRVSLQKADAGTRWGGLIEQIGEDSVLQ